MAEIWFILAVILVGMEIYMGFTLVLLFSALASFLVGLLVSIHVVPENNLVLQFAIFFFFTIISYMGLWKPMKTFLDKRKASGEQFSNYIGQEVEVIESELKKGETGLVKWSGSYIRARIADDASEEIYAVGEKLSVVSVVENIFIVKK